jgi:glucose/arabinose dehydrogenase
VAHRFLVALAASAILISGAVPSPARASHPVPTVTVVQDGLVVPWDVAFAPDGSMLVTERPGRVKVYASGAPGAALVSTLTIPSVRAEHESGVNGIAVDVAFATNPYVYVCASRDPDGAAGPEPWVNEVLRFRLTAAGTLDQMTVLFTGARANTQHNGCSVQMDTGGLLWVGIGDAGDPSLAQQPDEYNGKILRMTRTGEVPADNPILPEAGGRSLVYSLGHRNPQGIAFEPGTGRVYAAEHGPSRNDEINWIRPGENYGWPCYTGASDPHLLGGCAPASEYAAPAWASGPATVATSGMTFLTHASWESWAGSAVTAQLKEQDLRLFDVSDDGASLTQAAVLLDGQYGRLRAAVTAPDGSLYLTTSNGSGDRVLRVAPGPVVVDRFAGADRYETAGVISSRTFAPGVPAVYVATGKNFPDALTGGAAAARNGSPMLLVEPTRVPAATLAEIRRLAPRQIFVLGGSGAVSEGVRQFLNGYAPGGAQRVDGIDRYATAAAISNRFFPTGSPVAYVATGTNYPDALAGVPAAGLEGGPVLLVKPNAIPAQTVSELQRLRPQRIVVLGGTGAVSAAVAAALQQYTPTGIQRRAGIDRYETAVQISAASFPTGARHVLVATGRNYPDGLTGGPAGAARHGPLLLVPGSSLPPSVAAELVRLDPDRVTLLGGPGAVTDAVAAEIQALLNP